MMTIVMAIIYGLAFTVVLLILTCFIVYPLAVEDGKSLWKELFDDED